MRLFGMRQVQQLVAEARTVRHSQKVDSLLKVSAKR